MEHLLYGLMLRSGNDAAHAIAEHIGETVEDFASMMVKKAVEIGAKNTTLSIPMGFTMRSLYYRLRSALPNISYAMKNPTFRK